MPFNSTQIISNLAKNLTVAADHFKDVMSREIDAVNAPSKIKKHISVGTAQQKGNQLSIDVVIDTSKDAAPMAPAYEWGSGEHATRGKTGEYPIPKEQTGVKFPKERWPQYEPPPSAPDFFFFTQIMHPGVAPRPYIAPAIQESRQKMKEILGKNFKASILIGVPKVEVISA